MRPLSKEIREILVAYHGLTSQAKGRFIEELNTFMFLPGVKRRALASEWANDSHKTPDDPSQPSGDCGTHSSN